MQGFASPADRAVSMPVVRLCALLLVGTSLVFQAALADGLSPAEQRGKTIYETGRSESRRVITAVVREGEAPAPAAILPCASCHGPTGAGADDYTGVAPLEIDWYTLASTGQHTHDQRRHSAFDEERFAMAIRYGVDPDGNKLDSSMPRYRMADDDVADLVAYLEVIDSQTAPGIGAASLAIGTVLPTEGEHAGLGKAMRRTIESYFDSWNVRGGVHGRSLELVVGEWGANDDPPIWAARDLVSSEPVFALVSGYVAEFDEDYQALAEEQLIPLVGPYTALPPDGFEDEPDDAAGPPRYAFYSLSGLAQQAEVLVESVAAAADGGAARLAILRPDAASIRRVGDAAERRAATNGLDIAGRHVYRYGGFDPAQAVAALQGSGAGSVLFLGSADELVAFARAAESAGWIPQLLAPGLLAEAGAFELPISFDSKLRVAYAALPTDYTPDAAAEFERLHTDYNFDYSYSIAQVSAFTAARILVEGLERAGRDLSRDALVEALESMDGYHPGLTPPVTYTPDKRIGALGGHVIRANLAEGRYEPDPGWVELPPGDPVVEK